MRSERSYYDTIPSGVKITYRILSKSVCGGQTRIVGDSSCVEVEASPQTGSGAGTVYFYITDHLGTVRAILDVDGNIKSTHDFEPFGVELQPLSDESTNFHYKYTGQERDDSTNLDYMHFRFYASAMGRFLKPDNLIPDITNPQNWNAYSYVKGNPINFNDPTGHAADQPPQQENKQDEQPGPTQPANQNQAAMKKQEQKMVDQPKKVGVELKKPVPKEVEEVAKEVIAQQQADKIEYSAAVAYDAEGNVYKSSLHGGQQLSAKEKMEGKIEGKSSLSGPALDLAAIQSEKGVIFTKVYFIHSHPNDTPPTYRDDYTSLSEANEKVASYKTIGIVATPKTNVYL